MNDLPRIEVVLAVALVVVLAACRRPAEMPSDRPPEHPLVADVLAATASGSPGQYALAVEVRSPDRGCDQYADWWEVLDGSGQLLFRRVLSHSHVDEQPFVRSGAPVPIEAETMVWIRAHMNPSGYGGIALHGSIAAGFEVADLAPTFAANLADQPPQPPVCRW